jgi:phage-related protein
VAKSVDLLIRVLTDTAKAQQGMSATEKTVGRTVKTIAGIAGAIGGAMAVDKVVEFGKATMESASRTQQAMGAVDSVFGKSAGQIRKWSDESASAVGLSKSQYGELASVIGAQLKNLGVPLDQVASKTNDLVKMGADLAATYGGTTAQAVEALGSALRGETDPIERYGISIKQATIEAKVGKKNLKGMTQAQQTQAKTAALLALVTEQAGGAMGQFARESDSAAGAQQIATAQWEDAKSAIGTALLPLVSKLASVLGGMAGFIKDNSTAFLILVGVLGAVAGAIATVSAATSVYEAIVLVVGAESAAAWAAALWPILLVVAAVAAVIAILVVLWNKFPPFRNAVIAVWNGIRAAAVAVANWVRTAWQAIWPAISVALRVFATLFRVQFTIISTTVRLVAAIIGAVFRVAFGVIRAVATPVIAILRAGFNAIRPMVVAVASALRGPLGSALSFIGSAARAAGSVLSSAFSGFLSFIRTITGAVESLIGALNRIKVPKISLPKIPGLGRSVPAGTTAVAAPGGTFRASPLIDGRVGGTTSTRSGAVVINITGAIDPESTARQIRRILDAHDRRMATTGVLRTGTV